MIDKDKALEGTIEITVAAMNGWVGESVPVNWGEETAKFIEDVYKKLIEIQRD